MFSISNLHHVPSSSPPFTEPLPPPLTSLILTALLSDSAAHLYHSRAPPLPEIEHTDVPEVHHLVDVDHPHVDVVDSDFKQHEIKTETQAERRQREQEERERAEQARRAAEAKEKAKAKAREAEEKLKKNADNPVVLGNAVAVGLLGAALGIGAYRKYAAGELTWRVVGIWTGVVGLFAMGDYYVSQYVLPSRLS